MTQKEFSKYFNIPVRTLQDWEQERRTPPEYVVELIEYKLEKERLNMKKEIVNMSIDELMSLDNEILTEEELRELEEHELVTAFETLGSSSQHIGYTWYSVELDNETIDVYCKLS